MQSLEGNNQLDRNPRDPIIRNPAVGFAVLFGVFFIALILRTFVTYLATRNGEMSVRTFRIINILQDLFVFILPAICAAMFVTRLPANFLKLNVKPRLKPTLLALLVLVTSLPAMEWLINLNQSLQFPDALAGLEETLRGMEESASDGVATLIAGTSVVDLMMSILIVGILTGLAEELFFRGALQNLLLSSRVKKHLAVWLAAAIFSFMHFQFFGFLPRLLLGAYFGYLILWTGSVWVPVIAHAFNNSLVAIFTWATARSAAADADLTAVESVVPTDMVTILLSVLVTAIGLTILRRVSMQRR